MPACASRCSVSRFHILLKHGTLPSCLQIKTPFLFSESCVVLNSTPRDNHLPYLSDSNPKILGQKEGRDKARRHHSVPGEPDPVLLCVSHGGFS